CFYGESLESGEDLKAQLRSPQLAGEALVLILLASLTLATPSRATAGALSDPTSVSAKSLTATESASPGLPPAELDRSIEQVLQQRKYTWRMPREKIIDDEAAQGPIVRFLERVKKMIVRWLISIRDWLVNIIRKLFRPRGGSNVDSSGYGWMVMLQML